MLCCAMTSRWACFGGCFSCLWAWVYLDLVEIVVVW